MDVCRCFLLFAHCMHAIENSLKWWDGNIYLTCSTLKCKYSFYLRPRSGGERDWERERMFLVSIHNPVDSSVSDEFVTWTVKNMSSGEIGSDMYEIVPWICIKKCCMRFALRNPNTSLTHPHSLCAVCVLCVLIPFQIFHHYIFILFRYLSFEAILFFFLKSFSPSLHLQFALKWKILKNRVNIELLPCHLFDCILYFRSVKTFRTDLADIGRSFRKLVKSVCV